MTLKIAYEEDMQKPECQLTNLQWELALSSDQTTCAMYNAKNLNTLFLTIEIDSTLNFKNEEIES